MTMDNKGMLDITHISEVGPVDGLIGWWKLNGDIRDYSGFSNHGVNKGANLSSGVNNLSYEFSRVNGDYIDLQSKYIAGPTEGAVSAWINLYSTHTTYQSIYACQTGAAWAHIRLWLAVDSSNNVFLNIADGINYLTNSQLYYPLNFNQWYHVVGTYGGGTAHIYVNGIKIRSTNTTIEPGIFTPTTTMIGWHEYSDRYFDGKIEDLRVYNREILEEEVRLLYKLKTGQTKLSKDSSGTLHVQGHIKEGY